MKFTKLLSVILACVMLMGVFTVLPVSAAEEASIEIVANNLLFGQQTTLMYAVSAPEGAEVKLVLCDAEGNFVKEAEAAEEKAIVNGEECYVFLADAMPAHKAADKVYAKAQLIEDGEVVEETALNEYSILEYLYKAMFVAADQLDVDYVAMIEAYYAYAVAAQKVLDSEATAIESFVYVTVAENGTVGGKTAAMYSVEDVIDSFAHTLDTSDGSTVTWEFDIYNVATGAKSTARYSEEEIAAGAFVAPAFAATVIATPTLVAADAPEWTLVTDVADLAEGDQIVIVAKAYNYAMSTTQQTNNRTAASVTKNGNTVTFGDDVQILTIKKGYTAGTFAFYTGTGYISAGTSSSSNHLKTNTTLNNYGSWNITISADGTAGVKNVGNASRGNLKFNNSNSPKLFAAYGSGQADIAIYKLG